MSLLEELEQTGALDELQAHQAKRVQEADGNKRPADLRELIGALAGSELQLGRHAQLVGPLVFGQGVVDVLYVTFEVPRKVCLRLQVDPNAGQVGVIVNTLEASYGAAFRRTFTLKPGMPVVVRLFGRSIDVNVGPLGGGVANGITVNVNAELIADDIDALGELVPTWLPGLMPADGSALSVQGSPCALLRVEGDLAAFATGDTGPYYLMFFDSTVTPTSGVSNPFYVIGPIQAGSDFSSDHTVRPDLWFSFKVFAAFSKTDNVYTAVASGGGLDARVDISVGQ